MLFVLFLFVVLVFFSFISSSSSFFTTHLLLLNMRVVCFVRLFYKFVIFSNILILDFVALYSNHFQLLFQLSLFPKPPITHCTNQPNHISTARHRSQMRSHHHHNNNNHNTSSKSVKFSPIDRQYDAAQHTTITFCHSAICSLPPLYIYIGRFTTTT